MKKPLFVLAFIFFAAFMFMAAIDMRPFGEPARVKWMIIIENAQVQASSNNVVTSIVFDYRGFDTLGEGTVLFTAVIGIVALFREVAK